MDTVLASPAYAKVNLYLAIGKPYADGYHPIRSLFALVDLFDTVEVTVLNRHAFNVDVTGLEAYCEKGKDTLTKAARLWYEHSGCPLSLKIRCQKRIPVQAGLGGGSSDAAAVLLLLQRFAGADALDRSTLEEVALKVGSDVPFFLSQERCAIVSDRGQIVSSVKPRFLSVLLVMPKKFAISTSSAYSALDEKRGDKEISLGLDETTIVQIYEKSSSSWEGLLYNDFQECVGQQAFYEQLAMLSAPYVGYGSLSGSGACWFFVSEHQNQVQSLAKDVRLSFGDDVTSWVTGLVTEQ